MIWEKCNSANQCHDFTSFRYIQSTFGLQSKHEKHKSYWKGTKKHFLFILSKIFSRYFFLIFSPLISSYLSSLFHESTTFVGQNSTVDMCFSLVKLSCQEFFLFRINYLLCRLPRDNIQVNLSSYYLVETFVCNTIGLVIGVKTRSWWKRMMMMEMGGKKKSCVRNFCTWWWARSCKIIVH